MAAASTLRRAAAAAVHHRTAAVALLRPSATVTIHRTSSLHRPLLGPGASFGHRRLFSDRVYVDEATTEKILAEVARIDAAGVQRHAASNKEISALATKVMAYTEAVATKKYEKTVEVGQTSLKVSILVLVAAGFLGSTSLCVIYYAGRTAVTDKAKKLVDKKTVEIKMCVEEKLMKILTEDEQDDKVGMEPDNKARVAALQEWEERLLAREEALKKEEEEVEGGNNKKEVGGNQNMGP